MIMAEHREMSVLENNFALLKCSMHWCVTGLPRIGSCSTEGSSGTELHSKFL